MFCLPYLIWRNYFMRCSKWFFKKINTMLYTCFRKMYPWMCSTYLINNSECPIFFIILSRLNIRHSIWSIIEIYKILCIRGRQKYSRYSFISIFICCPKKEFIIFICNNSYISCSKICTMIYTCVITPCRCLK